MYDDLVVTILTGRRPHLLERTLSSAEQLWDWNCVTVIPYANGGDQETISLLANWCPDGLWGSAEWRSIGEGISKCADRAYEFGCRYWLHLEDDWEALRNPEGWYKESCAILDSHEADQVRLRDSSEKVLKRHMVTGQPIRWRQEGNFQIGEAHLTFNPSLMLTHHIPDAFPCVGERDAQRKWLKAGHTKVAQHVPGIWRHIGGGESLRGRQA